MSLTVDNDALCGTVSVISNVITHYTPSQWKLHTNSNRKKLLVSNQLYETSILRHRFFNENGAEYIELFSNFQICCNNASLYHHNKWICFNRKILREPTCVTLRKPLQHPLRWAPTSCTHHIRANKCGEPFGIENNDGDQKV